MINNELTVNKGMECAQKALEQAKNRVAVEKRKANAASLIQLVTYLLQEMGY